MLTIYLPIFNKSNNIIQIDPFKGYTTLSKLYIVYSRSPTSLLRRKRSILFLHLHSLEDLANKSDFFNIYYLTIFITLNKSYCIAL